MPVKRGNRPVIEKTNRLSVVYTIVSVLAVLVFLLLVQNRALFAEIEQFARERLLIASLLILAIYVLRAFIPFLPSFVFYTLTGRLMPGRFSALLLNLAGLFLLHSLSYLIGFLRRLSRLHGKKKKKSGLRLPNSGFFFLYRKYRFLKELFTEKTVRALGSGSFHTLLFFSLSPFPKKSFGKICGRAGIRFPLYIAASLLGALPAMTSATLLGKSLTDPTSPAFYASLILTVVVTVFSLVLFQKSNQEEKKHEKNSYR